VGEGVGLALGSTVYFFSHAHALFDPHPTSSQRPLLVWMPTQS
jgi:hypothetical protein